MSKLIGLGGYLRSGKDVVADYLEEKHGFVKLGMSDPLHEATLKLNPRFRLDYPIRLGYLWAKTYETYHYRDIIDAVGYVEAKKHTEIRTWLQILGTEVGREMIDENVWVNVAEKRIRALLDAGKSVVLTATRFPNEIEMIHRLGGETIWIARDVSKRLESTGGYESTKETQKSAQSAPTAVHASESSVGADDFDVTLENNGTLDELYEKVEALIPPVRKLSEYRSNWPVYDR